MRPKVSFVFLLLEALLCPQAPAQNQPEIATHDEPVTFGSRVNLVSVPVVVRNRDGKAVGTLQKEDFQVSIRASCKSSRNFRSRRAGHLRIMPQGQSPGLTFSMARLLLAQARAPRSPPCRTASSHTFGLLVKRDGRAASSFAKKGTIKEPCLTWSRFHEDDAVHRSGVGGVGASSRAKPI
jgi:hypothetical protein